MRFKCSIVSQFYLESFKLFKVFINPGKICWKAVHGKTAKGLLSGSSSTLYEGLLYCIGIGVCEALAFDPESHPSCWYHVGLSGSVKEEDLIPMKGSVIYLLDKSCVLPEGLNVDQSGPKVENDAPKRDEKPKKPKKKTPLGL